MRRERIQNFICRIIIIITLSVVVFSLVSFFIKERRLPANERAQISYQELLSQDTYNWEELDQSEFNIKTNLLSYSIVDLNNNDCPVLFLTSNGYQNSMDGDTRILIYNETEHVSKPLWGNTLTASVKGYIPCDETHEFPLIFCSGSTDDANYEYIFEVRNDKLILIAEKTDYLPYETEEVPEGSELKDKYIWMGVTVSLETYNSNRAQIVSGYTDIVWVRNIVTVEQQESSNG